MRRSISALTVFLRCSRSRWTPPFPAITQLWRRRCRPEGVAPKGANGDRQAAGTEVVILDDLLNSIETVVGEQPPDLIPRSESQHGHHNSFGIDLRIYLFAVVTPQEIGNGIWEGHCTWPFTYWATVNRSERSISTKETPRAVSESASSTSSVYTSC